MKFSGFSFLDVYTDLTKNQQNSRRSGRKGWLISHGMTHIYKVIQKSDFTSGSFNS